MANETALIPASQRNGGGQGLTRQGLIHPTTNLADARELGELLVASRFFQDTQDAAQAVVKVLAGAEIGLGPIASMTGIYIVKGRVTFGAGLMASTIQGSGRYNFRVTELTDQQASIDFYDNGEKIGTSTYTMADATKAGNAGNENYRKNPRNMLFARAMSNGAKWYTPAIFGGPVYVPEELGATVNEDGDVIDFQPVAPPAPVAAPVPEAATATAPQEAAGPAPKAAAQNVPPPSETPAPAAAPPTPPGSVSEQMEALGIGEVAQRFLLNTVGIDDISGDLTELYANLTDDQAKRLLAAAQLRAQQG